MSSAAGASWEGSETPVYLDYNATTPVLPEVLEAMLPYLRQHFGNPSSGHVFGVGARAGLERARAQVAELLGCLPEEVVFTGGGTEANNLAIRGVAEATARRRAVVTSPVEHPATAKPCALLERQGWSVARLPVDATGRVELDGLAELLAGEPALVTLMHANNEVGTLEPVAEVARRAREHGVLVHTDAAQSVGKVPTRVDELGVDLLSVAGHKLYAPKGVGALYVRRGTPLEPLVLGAGHERGLRPGTENVASIVALGQACAIAQRDLEVEGARVRSLREALFARLSAAIPGVALNGHPVDRLPNTLNVRFPGVKGSALLAACASRLAASTGSACHDGSETPSAVLTAMGLAPEVALGSVRLSLGRLTSPEEVERAAAALIQAFHALVAARG
ncbi:MAG: cysteine desulfurase [Deltaproteobacteria bacterium]|nr:cysteine desulfurase [Deltaproteobacteria bacterium]